MLRKEIHKLVRGAKKDFIIKICDDAIYGNMNKGAWETINHVLNHVLYPHKIREGIMLRGAAGDIATTANGNLEIEKIFYGAL